MIKKNFFFFFFKFFCMEVKIQKKFLQHNKRMTTFLLKRNKVLLIVHTQIEYELNFSEPSSLGIVRRHHSKDIWRAN